MAGLAAAVNGVVLCNFQPVIMGHCAPIFLEILIDMVWLPGGSTTAAFSEQLKDQRAYARRDTNRFRRVLG